MPRRGIIAIVVVVHLCVRPALRSIGSRVLVGGWLAITMDRWIVSWRRLDGPELAHELTHVRQWQQHGPIGYVARYAWASITALRQRQSWYRGNAFEVEAYAMEDAVRRGRAPDPRLLPPAQDPSRSSYVRARCTE